MAKENYTTGFICAQMLIIRLRDLRLLEYIFSVISAPYYLQILESKITGTAVRQLPAKEIAQMLIPIPPYQEQIRINQAISDLVEQTDKL